MNIEEELRGALDVPAPPPTTTLDDVLRRGRRRLFTRRAGAVFGALAVVAVIGLGSVVWNHAGSSVPAGNPADWPRVSTAERKPLDPARSTDCGVQMPVVPLERDFGMERFSADQLSAWRDRVQSALPKLAVEPEVAEDVVNTYELDVSDDRGTGSVRLSAGTFTGTPFQAADQAVWAIGACHAPRRATARDGTVYQLYDVVPSLSSSAVDVQTLHVYQPGGRVFRIEQVTAGRTNSAAVRESLPLTEEQLVKLGPAIAGVA